MQTVKEKSHNKQNNKKEEVVKLLLSTKSSPERYVELIFYLMSEVKTRTSGTYIGGIDIQRLNSS